MFVINKMFFILSFVEYPQNEKLLYIFRTRVEIKGDEKEKEKESLLKNANAELAKSEAMLANYKKLPVRNWIIRHHWKKDAVDDEFVFEISV
jgi:hypothetical protein